MLKRSILFLVVIVSLAWIAYSAFNILDDSNNYKPSELFGIHDEQVLILIRPSEVNLNALEDYNTTESHLLLSKLNDSLYNQGYVSKAQEHILLTRNTAWNQDLIKQLFGGIELKNLDKQTFNAENFNGRFYKKNLYLWKGEIKNEGESYDFIYDKKASASLINFAQETGISSYSDIYFKEEGKVNYITKNKSIKEGSKVSDEELFSGVISKNITSYHFFERKYKAALDSVFASGPMYRWNQFGFIELTIGNQKAIISDFIDGQDPILVLNDINGTTDTAWFSTPLTESFPTKGSKYKIEYLEDFVVISEAPSACNKLLSDYKLGSTIALNAASRERHYGNLPKSVSERYVSKESTYSRSAYNGKLLESHTAIETATKAQTNKETISLSVGADIKDFYAFEGDGNVITLSSNGQVKRFVNQVEKWTKPITGSVKGNLQIIDLHASGEKQILITTSDQIHLFDLDGNYTNGFPINLDNDALYQSKFYRWKGKSYFLTGMDNGKILMSDAKGRELNLIRSKTPPTKPIQVWASQNRLFAGFSDDNSFEMYDLDKRRSHRDFAITPDSKALKVPNEMFHYGIKDNKLLKIDQKGNQISLGDYKTAKVIKIAQGKTTIIAVQSTNELHLLNAEGIPFGEIRLPFNEIEDIFIENTDSGKTLVGVLDGLENNVYLYTTDGQLITKKGVEGQNRLMIHSSNQGYRITTIVDQFIIQHFEN